MVSLFRRKKGTKDDQAPSISGASNHTTGSASDTTGESNRNTPKTSQREIQKEISATTTSFRVKIPPNVRPGGEFQVYGKYRSYDYISWFSCVVLLLSLTQSHLTLYSLLLSWKPYSEIKVSTGCSTRTVSCHYYSSWKARYESYEWIQWTEC